MRRHTPLLEGEILVGIFQYFMHYELVEFGLVCKLWHKVAQDSRLWAKLYRYYSAHVWHGGEEEQKMIEEEIGGKEMSKEIFSHVTVKLSSSPNFLSSSPVFLSSTPPDLSSSPSKGKSKRASLRISVPTQADFKDKMKRTEKKDSKSPRKSRRFSLRSRSNSLPITFGDASREWSSLGGFRQDHSDTISAEEAAVIKIWHSVPIPSRAGSPKVITPEVVDIKKIWKSPYLKYLVRKGIPDIHRPGVWANMVGVKDVISHTPNMYQTTLRTMFGLNPPQKFYRIPNFGGPSFDLLCDDHALSPEGTVCAQRILVVLAMENPEITFCPTLTDLVQIFLRYLTESEAYVASKLLLTRSIYLTCSTPHPPSYSSFSNAKRNATQYFAGSFKGTLASCRVFDLLVKQYVPRLHASLKDLDLSVGVMLYHKWFNRLFVGVVPIKVVLRIFDIYLLEGLKGIFRIGLAILRYCEEELIQTKNSQEFAAVLASFQETGLDEAIFDDAQQIPLRRAVLGTLYQQSFIKLGVVKEPYSHVYYHPKNLQCSKIIAEDEFEMLWTWLPATLRIKDPHPVFDSDEDGCSLRYMLSKIERFEFTLFIIRSTEDRVFGFFVSTPWNTAQCRFFGNRESFVFTLRPVPDQYRWTPGHANDRMQYVTNGGISLGAGPPAICLRDDLSITSHACPTFQSPPLGLMSNFGTLIVEVYSIH